MNTPPDPPEEGERLAASPDSLRAHARDILHILWRSTERNHLMMLGGALVIIIGATAWGQIQLNAWNQPFYDAIARKDFPGFLHQVGVFVVIAAGLLVLNVAQMWLNQTTKVRMRVALMEDLLAEWLKPLRAFRLSSAGEIATNPDQRLHEDARHLCELSTDLGVGLLQASLLLLTFIGVLWTMSSEVIFTIGETRIAIPGFMVWSALFYAGAASVGSYFVGRPLIGLNAERYAREADLRFALVSVSEQIDAIALDQGESDVRQRLGIIFGTVVDVSKRIAGSLTRLTWITSGYGWFTIVAPILVAAPAYFIGSMTLGELMMAVGAFNQVQMALKWFIDNFSLIADWRATLARVLTFRRAAISMDQVGRQATTIRFAETADHAITLENLRVSGPAGCIALSEPEIRMRPGERVLIAGEAGIGKTMLFRAIAGLWPWGAGCVTHPPHGHIMYLPAHAYIPPGTLRTAVTYPASGNGYGDVEIAHALVGVGLEHLLPKLDRNWRWDRDLSEDEKQCLAFARVILHRPAWVVADEAFDVLDMDSRKRIRDLFAGELKEVGLLSIGHDEPDDPFFTRRLRIVGDPGGPTFRL